MSTRTRRFLIAASFLSMGSTVLMHMFEGIWGSFHMISLMVRHSFLGCHCVDMTLSKIVYLCVIQLLYYVNVVPWLL